MANNGPDRFHKRIRLDKQVYAQLGGICSITIGVQGRRPVFADQVLAASAVEVLRSHASKTGVKVYGYCIMPDHVHLVLGPSVTCDITTFVGQIKNLAQRAAWTNGTQGRFWQASFWDHFLRAEEDVEHVIEYVLSNPVRRGLAEHWRDFRFSGSLVFDLK